MKLIKDLNIDVLSVDWREHLSVVDKDNEKQICFARKS